MKIKYYKVKGKWNATMGNPYNSKHDLVAEAETKVKALLLGMLDLHKNIKKYVEYKKKS